MRLSKFAGIFFQTLLFVACSTAVTQRVECVGNGRFERVSQELAVLYGEYCAFSGNNEESGAFRPPQSGLQIVDGNVFIEATASLDSKTLRQDLVDLGAKHITVYERYVSALLPIASIPRLEALDSLAFARAVLAVTKDQQP